MSWLPNELEDFDTILLSLLNDLDEKRKLKKLKKIAYIFKMALFIYSFLFLAFLVRMREMIRGEGSLIIHSMKESSNFSKILDGE